MAEPKRPPTAPEECANCGATIPRGARACPECGADERTGWRETDETRYDGLELPDEAWADDGNAQVQQRRRADRRVNGIAWYWWAAGVALILLLVLGGLRLF